MMKQKTKWFSISICLMMIVWMTACTSHEHQHTNKQAPITGQLTLTFQATPDKAIPGKPITLTANVKADNQPVTDAKVEFEVWKNGNKKHDMLETKQNDQGKYSTTATYYEQGEYLVVVHTTTPQVHQMINGSFQVGEAPSHKHT